MGHARDNACVSTAGASVDVGLKRTALGYFTQLTQETSAADLLNVLTDDVALGLENAYSDASAKDLPVGSER